MTIIYITKYNTNCYGVTFQIIECVKVQNIEDFSNDEKTILNIKPIERFLGKSRKCDMTTMSGAFIKSEYDGKTILLNISKECNRHRYLYIEGDMVCSFPTNDNICDYIWNMGTNLTPYSIALGDENIYC